MKNTPIIKHESSEHFLSFHFLKKALTDALSTIHVFLLSAKE